MFLPEFEFHEPSIIDQACEALSVFYGEAKPFAGGTDLLVRMKKGIASPKHLISLNRITELKKIDLSDTQLKIGACVSVTELADSQVIAGEVGALGEGAKKLGSPAIRNLATIAGNIVSARPAADLPPSLLAYGAKLLFRSSSGERRLGINEFFLGPGETEIRNNEILTEIVIDRPPRHSGASYITVNLRKSLSISLVSVAAYVSLDDQNGAITGARIALGAVAPKPFRSSSAEKLLLEEQPSERLFHRAGQLAASDCRPISDFRASEEYRREVVRVLTERALWTALEKAKSNPLGGQP